MKAIAIILFIIELIILGYLFSRIWIMIRNYEKKSIKKQ